jgi:hypothetical protein
LQYLHFPSFQVAFLSHNSEVTVETVEGVEDHIHEEEPPSINNSSTFKWSDEMTKVVMEWIHAKPNFIKRKLKGLGCKMPTQTQLYNKIAATKKTVFPSGEWKWYEGEHPFQISNNQGVEGKNREIKQNHTFRKRLEIGELVAVLARMVSEWSEEDDRLLESSRSAALEKERNSLSLKTDGYQWYKVNKKGSDKILRINPKDKYTVSESSEFL